MQVAENKSYLTQKNILLVEDSLDTQFILQLLLEESGANIECVDTGQGALELLTDSKKEFDLVLVDVQLPGISGFDVAKSLRNSNYKGLLVAMTARCLLNDYEASIYAGFNGYISKSTNKANFVQTIELFSSLLHENDETEIIYDNSFNFDLQPIRLEQEYLYRLKESSKALQLAFKNSDFAKARMLLEVFRSGKAFGFPKVTKAAKELLLQLEKNSVNQDNSPKELIFISETFH